MRAALIAIAVLLLLAMGAGRKYSSVRAELVQQREEINKAWTLVDSALEKRAELVYEKRISPAAKFELVQAQHT